MRLTGIEICMATETEAGYIEDAEHRGLRLAACV